MLKIKPRYIAGLLLSSAVFGLINCSDKTKNDNPIVNEQDQPNLGGFEPYADPTLVYSSRINVDTNDSQSGIPGNRLPVFTTLKYNDSLLYTDSSVDSRNKQDTLMEIIKADILLRFSSDEVEGLKDFARSLKISQIALNPLEPDDVSLNFTIKRGNSEVKYSMTGKIGDIQGRRGRVEERVAVLESKTGPKDIDVRLRCMDRRDTCHNSTLVFEQKSSNRIAIVLFRTTPADVSFYTNLNDQFHADLHPFLLSNPQSSGAFELDEILQNSVHTGSGRRKPNFKTVLVESSSILFGQSHFALVARINNSNNSRETVLSVFGPLVRPQDSNSVGLSLGDSTQHSLLKNASDYDPIMKTISKVTLLENNGRGSLQMELSFGAGQQRESVVLTIARKSVELRALTD